MSQLTTQWSMHKYQFKAMMETDHNMKIKKTYEQNMVYSTMNILYSTFYEEQTVFPNSQTSWQPDDCSHTILKQIL